MSAESIPPIPESTPNFVVLPPAVPGDGTPAASASATAGAGASASGSAAGSGLPPALQALARNPIVLAGGAVLAGVVLSRFMATPSARRLAKELAAEAFKHLKPAATGAAGMAGTAAAGSILEKGVEKYGPQIADYAKKMLADLLRKKE